MARHPSVLLQSRKRAWRMATEHSDNLDAGGPTKKTRKWTIGLTWVLLGEIVHVARNGLDNQERAEP
jgi:hypothetical protein